MTTGMALVILFCLEIVTLSALAVVLCSRRVALVERDSGRVAVGPLPLRLSARLLLPGACFLVARSPALTAAGLDEIAVLPGIFADTVRVRFTDGVATTLLATPRAMISSELDLALLKDC